jgi:hypothetical protein
MEAHKKDNSGTLQMAMETHKKDNSGTLQMVMEAHKKDNSGTLQMAMEARKIIVAHCRWQWKHIRKQSTERFNNQQTITSVHQTTAVSIPVYKVISDCVCLR